MLKKLASIAALGALVSIPALAQQNETARYDRALAAGYKAQFLCSGLWNGGKALADIKADELTGIYDRIADIVPTLAEDIDESRRHKVLMRLEDINAARSAYPLPMMRRRGSRSGIARPDAQPCRSVSPEQTMVAPLPHASFTISARGQWATGMLQPQLPRHPN